MNFAFKPLQVTVITAVPFFFPFTTPVEDTVATFLLLDLYVAFPAGVAFTLIATVLPFLIEAEDFTSFREGFLTVIVTFFVYFPAFTVMVVFPAFFAVTTPFAFTVATFLLLEVNFAFAVIPFLTTLMFVVFLPPV